jgi:hypothetical protein
LLAACYQEVARIMGLFSRNVTRPHRAPGIIAWFLLAVLFVESVYRAATISISMDEAFTYLRFVAPPVKQILRGIRRTTAFCGACWQRSA